MTEKKKNLFLKVIVIICSILIISIILFTVITDYIRPNVNGHPYFTGQKDLDNRTIIITDTNVPYKVYWSDIECNGNATLPSGTIDVGDVITNCSGIVILWWPEYNMLMGTWEFPEVEK